MRHLLISFFSFALLLPLSSHAGLSARRLTNQSFAQAKAFATGFKAYSVQFEAQSDDSNLARKTDPESLSKPLKDLKIMDIPNVDSYPNLENQFDYVRDTRFLETSDPAFPRRLTWLYPDDGCFARAELAAEHLVTNNFVLPKKVFAFGDLSAETVNSPDGSVQWWYHVAVIYRVGDQAYVLDPALNPKAPMTLQDWSSAIGGDKTPVTFAVCSKDTFDPDSDCFKPTALSAQDAESEQRAYLDSEWQRLLELNRDPQKELGEFPPWLVP